MDSKKIYKLIGLIMMAHIHQRIVDGQLLPFNN